MNIFTSINQIKELTDVNIGVNFNSLKSTLRLAGRKYIRPLIGDALMTKAETIAASATPTPLEAAYLRQMREALAPLALALYIPRSEAAITDSGVRRGGTNEMPGAYKYQVQAVVKSYEDDGLEALEEVLTFLELHKSVFTEWATSEQRNKYNALAIRSGNEFNEYYTLLRPHLSYNTLLPHIYNTEVLTMMRIFGNTFSHLKDKQAAGTINSEERHALALIKYAIANLSISNGVSSLNVRIDDNGISVLSNSTDSSQDGVSKREAASDNALSLLLRQTKDTAKQYIEEARRYLDANATSTLFEEWYNDLLSRVSDTGTGYNNNQLNGVFSV